MTRESVDEALKQYREKKARYDFLCLQIDVLQESLQKNEKCMVNDRVSMSQAITGMPHGTSVGDPVGNLALDLAMGKVTVFVDQIRLELQQVQTEMNGLKPAIACVDIWMNALNDREREVVSLKAINQYSWADAVQALNEKCGGVYSKHTFQRLYDRAMEKIYTVAA